MPKLKERVISIELANAIRETVRAMKLNVPKGRLGFRCPKCLAPVKAHRGKKRQAHFEHLRRSACEFSHRKRRA